MIVSEFYTPDTMDVDEKLAEAVEELKEDEESPEQELFAVDALGNRPEDDHPTVN